MSYIRKYQKLFTIVFSIILISFYMHPTLMMDESFTMALASKSYGSIIHLTSLDIHPPLYYLVLKLFLQFFTFWTSNMFIKVTFARIFSILCSYVLFIYLHKIANFFNFKYNKYFMWILFLFMPLILGSEEQLTNIRMYAFAMMLMSIEVYYILMYLKIRNIHYIFIFTIMAVFTFYTNYYSALIAGLYILLLFFYFIFVKEFKVSSYILLSGILFLLFCIPWFPNLIYQLYLTGNSRMLKVSFSISFLELIKLSKFIFIFLIPFLFIYKNLSNEFRRFYFLILFISIINLITLVKGPSFRYLCSSYVIYIYILV